MKHALHSFLILTLAMFISWGCATTRNAGDMEGTIATTPQMVDNTDYTGRTIDANISSAIRLKFASDGLLSDSDINVDTSHGKVTLKGKVDTQASADRALQLGRSADGVKSVHSRLTVKGIKTNSVQH
jgi:hyperosmotically inducible periplasmic protein